MLLVVSVDSLLLERLSKFELLPSVGKKYRKIRVLVNDSFVVKTILRSRLCVAFLM